MTRLHYLTSVMMMRANGKTLAQIKRFLPTVNLDMLEQAWYVCRLNRRLQGIWLAERMSADTLNAVKIAARKYPNLYGKMFI